MAQGVQRKLPKMRFSVSAITALLLMAGITTVLQSASAVTVTLTPASSSVAATGTISITFAVVYSSDEFIPVLFNRLIFEGPTPPKPIALQVRWGVTGGLISNGGCSGVTTSVANTGLATVAGYGFGASGTYVGRNTGYGYDSNAGFGAQGYGGGQTGIANNANVFAGYGYGAGAGYGYAGGQSTLTYTVTIPATCLATGSYRVTGEVATDYWSFQSAFTTISVGSGGGSGGGGSTVAAGTPGTGAGQTQTVTATATVAPAGALAAYTVTIAAASSGNTIVVNTGDASYPTITLVTSGELTNAVVTVVSWPATTPPTGTAPLPPGLTTSGFFEITVTNADGKISRATIALSIPQANVSDATKGALLRFENGVWNPVNTLALTLVGGKYTGNVDTPCCSSFAVVFDTTPPQVTLGTPTGALSGMQKFTADASDNLKLTKVEFYVGDALKGTDTVAPFELDFDTKTVTNGDQAVKAMGYDYVGNTAQSEKTVNVQNAATPAPGPGDGEGRGGVATWIWIVLGLVVLALIIGAVVMSGKKK